MNEKTKNEVAIKPAGAVGSVMDYGNDAGAGFDKSTTSDMIIPMLKVLQALSPEVKEKKGEIGQIWNNVFEVPSNSLRIVPVFVDHQYVQWHPRSKGGGRVRSFQPSDPEIKAFRDLNPEAFPKIYTERGGNDKTCDQVVETYYLYCLILNDDDQVESYAVFPIKSGFITPYRKWNTAVKTFLVDTPTGDRVIPPLFAHRVLFTTFTDRKNEDEFANIKFGPAVTTNPDAKRHMLESLIPPSSNTYKQAKDFLEMIQSGIAKVDFEREDTGSTSANSNGGEKTAESF